MTWRQLPERGGALKSLTLSIRPRQNLSRWARGGFEGVKVRGHPAYLVWIGDPGVGQLALFWNEDGPCEAYSLHLLYQGASQRATEREIMKIGRGLTTNY